MRGLVFFQANVEIKEIRGAGDLVYNQTCSRGNGGKWEEVGIESESGRRLTSLVAACFR